VQKRRINNISSSVIPFRREDPRQIFTEVKDGTHPLLCVRGGLCTLGGNWIGAAAANDRGPKDTVVRELGEELTLTGRPVNTEKLVALGFISTSEEYSVSPALQQPDANDEKLLDCLVSEIVRNVSPFGCYLNTVTTEAIRAADPGATREGFTSLSCIWTSALGEDSWNSLSYLQKKYGNLSNESISMVLSLDDILRQNLTGAFAQEHVLRNFFTASGFSSKAVKIRTIPDQASVYAGPVLETYAEYLTRYDVAKMPPINH
jgi:hypothetical protein